MSGHINTLETYHYDLGNPLGQFSSRSDFLRELVPVGLILSAFLCSNFAIKDSGDSTFLRMILVLLSLFAVAKAIDLIIQNYREGNWRVHVFDQGMYLSYKGEEKVLRWSDITSLDLGKENRFTLDWGSWEDPSDGIPGISYRTYTICLQNGEKYTFSGVALQPLGDLLKKKITDHTLSRPVPDQP